MFSVGLGALASSLPRISLTGFAWLGWRSGALGTPSAALAGSAASEAVSWPPVRGRACLGVAATIFEFENEAAALG